MSQIDDFIKRRRLHPLNPNLAVDVEELSEEISKQFKKYHSSSKFDLNSEEVFCICRRPDQGELMICCDGCEEWFHFKCMRLDLTYSKLVAKFFCKFCQWKGVGNTKWKKKCRLEGCFESIANESKYCSEDHGKRFMREKLGIRKSASSNTNDVTTSTSLSSETVLQILSYIGLDHEKFIALGTSFPELEDVTKFMEGKIDVAEFPVDIKAQLDLINSKLRNVRNEIVEYESRIDYLVKVKELIKAVNERLQGALGKVKKLDICCYDKLIVDRKGFRSDSSILDREGFRSDSSILDRRGSISDPSILDRKGSNSDTGASSLEDVLSTGLFEELKMLIEQRLNDETNVTWLGDNICIQDRRKCIRHNGWWNLVNDELEKKMVGLNNVAEKLEEEKATVLRGYSVAIYEKLSEKAEVSEATNTSDVTNTSEATIG